MPSFSRTREILIWIPQKLLQFSINVFLRVKPTQKELNSAPQNISVFCHRFWSILNRESLAGLILVTREGNHNNRFCLLFWRWSKIISWGSSANNLNSLSQKWANALKKELFCILIPRTHTACPLQDNSSKNIALFHILCPSIDAGILSREIPTSRDRNVKRFTCTLSEINNQLCTYLVYKLYCVLSFRHVRLHYWAALSIPLVEAWECSAATSKERYIKYIMPLRSAILECYPARGIWTHDQINTR